MAGIIFVVWFLAWCLPNHRGPRYSVLTRRDRDQIQKKLDEKYPQLRAARVAAWTKEKERRRVAYAEAKSQRLVEFQKAGGGSYPAFEAAEKARGRG